MELQKFCKDSEAINLYNDYKERALKFVEDLGLSFDKLRFHDHDKLAHYAKCACDIQYHFPIGWEELNGIHHRGTWDLSRHSEFSGEKLEYLDPDTNEKFTPTVIEYSIGADRLTLALLCEGYAKETLTDGSVREVMHLAPFLAPYKVAVLPLIKKNHSEKAMEVFNTLSKHFMTTYDETANIGKRYRREDAIGTPFCVTIDDETLNNNTVTVRDRDTMEQITIELDKLVPYIEDKIKF